MPKEVILNGFRVQVPLTPEAVQRVERIGKGLDVLRSKLPKLSAWGVLSGEDFQAIDMAALELVSTVEDLLIAHHAAVGRPLSTRPS